MTITIHQKGNIKFVTYKIFLGICIFSFVMCFYVETLLKAKLHNGRQLFGATTDQPCDLLHRFQDFSRDWLRQRRARVDWKSIIKPCFDNMEWGLEKNHWGKGNRSSGRASQVVYQDIRPAGEFSKIFIQSRTADNRTKTIGGDAWRVYVRGPSSVGATVFDHANGTYEALFLLTEPGNYQLKIYLDYSLCDGLKEPPKDWFILGDAQGKRQKEGLLGPIDAFLFEPYKDGRPFTINVPEATTSATFIEKLQYDLSSSSQSCNHLWDGFGEWKNKTWRPYVEESYNWSLPHGYRRNGTLHIFGDSMGVRLANSVQSRELCQSLYSQCLYSYQWIYPRKQGRIEDDDNLDFRPEVVIRNILDILQSPSMRGKENLLLLNLGLHFPQCVNFASYQKLIRDLIHILKKNQGDSKGNKLKYTAKVLWKTNTAIRKENVEITNLTSWRFFTAQRIALFSTFALSAMCEAGFNVVDVFPITDSYPDGALDQVHYSNDVFSALELLLEKYKVRKNRSVGESEKKDKLHYR
ncbi:uncharacterized protein [Montipora foliosa]|uniref:uncharacterized protein n=1 Tax=Montipora foliosa TaxID=591990 RepID=UPI0035F19741